MEYTEDGGGAGCAPSLTKSHTIIQYNTSLTRILDWLWTSFGECSLSGFGDGVGTDMSESEQVLQLLAIQVYLMGNWLEDKREGPTMALAFRTT